MSFSPAKCEKGRPAFSILKDWKMSFLNLLLNCKELAKKIIFPSSSSWPRESKQQHCWDGSALHSWLGCVKNRWPGHQSGKSLLAGFVIATWRHWLFKHCFSHFWENILSVYPSCSWAGSLGQTSVSSQGTQPCREKVFFFPGKIIKAGIQANSCVVFSQFLSISGLQFSHIYNERIRLGLYVIKECNHKHLWNFVKGQIMHNF